MTRALVMTHGNIGGELIQVVEMILGPVEGLAAMSNNGLGAEDLVVQVREWLGVRDGSPGKVIDPPAVIFIDDCGGSCATSAQLAVAEHSGAIIVSGVNLAMLLGFLTWRDDSGLAELAQLLVRKGREAILQVGKRE